MKDLLEIYFGWSVIYTSYSLINWILYGPKPKPQQMAKKTKQTPLVSETQTRTRRDLDRTKIDYISTSLGSHCSTVKEGVFPPGTTREEVRQIVVGSFGGHFHKWDEKSGEFYFIAYTD